MKIIKSREEMAGMTNTMLGMRKQQIIPLPTSHIGSENVRENMDLLEECRRYWESLRDFRERRSRNRKYYRGEQWSDFIKNPDSKTSSNEYITEEQYIMNQGKVPLKQNQIRQLVKNLIGQYRSNPSKSMVIPRARENALTAEMLTNALQCALDNNFIEELDARIFEEFANSGAIPQKIGYKYWKDRSIEDILIENRNPAKMFYNSDVSDIRLLDLRLIGEIIDTTLDDIISSFAKSEADEKRIRQIYTNYVKNYIVSDRGHDASLIDNMDFFMPRDMNVARMFEIWRLEGKWETYAHDPLDGTDGPVDFSMEEIAQQNAERLQMGMEQGIPQEEIPLIEAKPRFINSWYVKYLAPSGHVLFEGKSPYSHEEHPYAFTLYPLLDGEVWGFIEDIIDQQRYINRLIIMMDFAMSASAKGVLLVPEDLIPEGMTPDDFAEQWTKFNGVILYKPNTQHTQKPEQIVSKSTPMGFNEMIQLQMSLLQEISGVHGAIQGKAPGSGTPAALYAQEAQNASMNTLDYMHTFKYHKQKRDTKVLKVLTQYYQDERYLAINGRTATEEAKIYKPEMAQNIQWELVVTAGTDTPVYKQVIESTLMELLNGRLIDLEMWLEHTTMPFADKLLASVRQQKEQMLQSGAVPPELAAMAGQAPGGVNPQTMQLANQFMGRPAA